MQVKAFIIDHLEEVHNKIGGVIGYELHCIVAPQAEAFVRAYLQLARQRCCVTPGLAL